MSGNIWQSPSDPMEAIRIRLWPRHWIQENVPHIWVGIYGRSRQCCKNPAWICIFSEAQSSWHSSTQKKVNKYTKFTRRTAGNTGCYCWTLRVKFYINLYFPSAKENVCSEKCAAYFWASEWEIGVRPGIWIEMGMEWE